MRPFPRNKDEMLTVNKAFTKPVSLELVSINLCDISGDFLRGLASGFVKSYAALEEYARNFNISIEDAEHDAELAVGLEDDKFISMIARAIFEAIRETDPDVEEITWGKFVIAMKNNPNVAYLYAKNPIFVKRAEELLGKAFAEATVLDEREGKLPDVDDPKVNLITQHFVTAARMVLK